MSKRRRGDEDRLMDEEDEDDSASESEDSGDDSDNDSDAAEAQEAGLTRSAYMQLRRGFRFANDLPVDDSDDDQLDEDEDEEENEEVEDEDELQDEELWDNQPSSKRRRCPLVPHLLDDSPLLDDSNLDESSAPDVSPLEDFISSDTGSLGPTHPLHDAAENGQLELVQHLLQRDDVPAIDALNEDDETPLSLAASEGHLQVVKLLLRHGAKINARHNDYAAYSHSPLIRAIQNRHVHVVDFLCKKGAKVGEDYLKVAVESGSAKIFQTVADHFAPYESLATIVQGGLEYEEDGSELGENWMFLAARASGEMLDFLKSQGGSLDRTDEKGRALLHAASQAARVDALEYLLDNGANINARANDGTTPLMRLFIPDPEHFSEVEPEDFHAAFELLIRRGADPNARDQRQQTVLHYAVSRVEPAELEHLCTSENVNAQDQDGNTPLHLIGLSAERADTLQRVLALVKHGAQLSVTNKTRRSVLDHLLEELGGADFVELMSRIVEDFPNSLQEEMQVRVSRCLANCISQVACNIPNLQPEVPGTRLTPAHLKILFTRVPVDRCKLFLVGDGGAGKTALRRSLRQVRDLNDPDLRVIEEHDDPNDPESRTLGIEFDDLYLRSDGVPAGDPSDDAISVCIQDHGGQKCFHVFHDLFFQSAYAVYVVVIRIDTNDEEAVREQLVYWLNFLCSTVKTGHAVVVLSGWREGLRMGRKRRAVVNVLQEFDRPNGSKLRFASNPVLLDCRKSGSEKMTAFRAALYEQFQTQLTTRVTMPAACDALREYIVRLRASRLFAKKPELLAGFWKVDHTFTFVTPTMFEKLCEYLQQTGDLLLLPLSWVAVDPNRFTSQIIGELFKPATLGGVLRSSQITEHQINEITRASEFFAEPDVMPTILEYLGLCIRLPASQSPGEAQAAYFPCLTEALFDPAAASEIVTGEADVNMLGCRFQLPAQQGGIFFETLFPRLVTKLYSELTPPSAEGTQDPRLWKNAVSLHRKPTVGRAVRILVDHNLRQANSFFDVIVWCEPTNAEDSLQWPTTACYIVLSHMKTYGLIFDVSLLRSMRAVNAERILVKERELRQARQRDPGNVLQRLFGFPHQLEGDRARIYLQQLEILAFGEAISTTISRRLVSESMAEANRYEQPTELVELIATLLEMQPSMDNLFLQYQTIFFSIPDDKRKLIKDVCARVATQLGDPPGELRQPSFGFSSTTKTDYLDRLYDTCYDELPAFSQLVADLQVPDTELKVCSEAKEMKRILEKSAYCYQGDFSRVIDIIRGSIIANSDIALIETLERIHQQAMDGRLQVRRIKNRLDAHYDATESCGYRDLQLIVVLPGSGILAELQLHLRRIMEVKSGGGGGHAAYVQYRTKKEQFEFLNSNRGSI